MEYAKGFLFFILMCFAVIGIFFLTHYFIELLDGGSNYSTENLEATKIVYDPKCKGCKAVNSDGSKSCAYCGKSLLKKTTKLTRDEFIKEAGSLVEANTPGEYALSSDPNTYIKVSRRFYERERDEENRKYRTESEQKRFDQMSGAQQAFYNDFEEACKLDEEENWKANL